MINSRFPTFRDDEDSSDVVFVPPTNVAKEFYQETTNNSKTWINDFGFGGQIFIPRNDLVVTYTLKPDLIISKLQTPGTRLAEYLNMDNTYK